MAKLIIFANNTHISKLERESDVIAKGGNSTEDDRRIVIAFLRRSS